jgi:hypothetical protein
VLGFLSGHPGAVWRAFLRGSRTRNLYRIDYDDALLDASLAEMWAKLGLDRQLVLEPATLAERAGFAAWSVIAIALALATTALLAAPVILVMRALI